MKKKKKTNRSVTSRLYRLLSVAVAAALAASFTVGCDGGEVTVNGNDDNQSQNDNDTNNDNDHNHNDPNHDDDYFEAHGPDDDMELIPAGQLQGSWRAAFVDGDRPLAYFDIFHDEGESTASGDFLQGMVPHEMYDGTSGSLESVTIDGTQVEIDWNPTDADDEMFTVILERDDDDTYHGTFEAAMYRNTYEVEMELRNQ